MAFPKKLSLVKVNLSASDSALCLLKFKFKRSHCSYRLSTLASKHQLRFKQARTKAFCNILNYVPEQLPNASLTLALRRERQPVIPKTRSLPLNTPLVPILAVQEQRSTSVSPALSSSWEKRSDEKSNPRRKSWKWNKIICKYSSSAKMKKLQSSQRSRRQSIVDQKRGLNVAVGNLGVVLHITDEYIPELDMDENQDYPTACASLTFDCPDIRAVTVKDNVSPELSLLLSHAEQLVKTTFASYEILMDLVHTREDGFTLDLIVDFAQSRVIASQEFVFMKKYLWLESLVVSSEYRRKGYGRALIKRLIKIASAAQKSILLYSLFDSLPFYFSCGFQLSKDFPFMEGHHGLFLELKVASEQ
ncbi:hypothetical protein HDU91_001687 [Kappamyces sp. JEL0680]|nr:hypothetical protein HDU91_001687 [Kappamyces sp. JEL0680]